MHLKNIVQFKNNSKHFTVWNVIIWNILELKPQTNHGFVAPKAAMAVVPPKQGDTTHRFHRHHGGL